MDFSFLKRRRYKGNISAINIRWQSAVHAIKGLSVSERVFDLDIPFKNKIQENPLQGATVEGEELLKMQKQKSAIIKGINVDKPFNVVLVEPALPIEIKPDNEVMFKIKIEAPEHSFNGPLNLSFVSDSVETAHIEITKIVLKTKSKIKELEESSKMFDMPRGLIFTQKIQVYKIMSYGDRADAIVVNPPFKLISTDPKVPFTVDNKDSYVVTLYMVTDAGYAGPLEILFE